MQLEPPFEYHILANDDLDMDDISIPSLIIQPFVENAFKHAFPLKKGLKKLTISFDFYPQNQLLKVCIDDNGIGRVAAANTAKNTTYQSFATQANTKRLELLNKTENEHVSVHFEDKTDAENMPLGTTVTLIIQC